MISNTRKTAGILALWMALGAGAPAALAGGNLLSAGWGLDNALPAFPGCSESVGRDGMPVVMDREVEHDSLDASDFEVELASGARQSPVCATLLPALEENENRTVLLIGDLGSQDDPPRWARVVGELRGEDSAVLGGAVAVPDYDGGPSLIVAEPAVLNETECPAGTASALRLIFSGGVVSIDGDELDQTDLERFSVETLDGVVTPIDFSDLFDQDNNVELCLETSALAVRVSVDANSVVDPNGDANEATATSVDRSDEALELTGIWFDPAAPGDGFTVTQGGSGTVVYFFGYDASGQRLWLVTDVIQSEIFAQTTLSVPAYLGETGIFAMPGDAVAPWGSLTIRPRNCDSVRFELEGLDGSKTFEGIRLADGGRPC
ncbi:MAG: hypothetical protein AAGE01_06350 [Pseudomonadota bacterium]